jgi:G-patch domain
MSEKRGSSVQNGKLYQGVAKTDFGYRMLQNMGWAEGKVSG